MASNSTNKRRRTAADTLHISDLPVGFIVNVAEYLPKPSRAILATTLSGPSSSWKSDLIHRPSSLSAAILSASQWDILDFEDIEKELANKLTDEDINAVLKYMNARDVLKKLKLCGCINITGIGLSPLRGSIVLEQIDISLARKHKRQGIYPEPKISEEATVPILDDIISADGCSLKYIQFPIKWIGIGMYNAPTTGFVIRFNRYLHSRTSLDLDCSKCNRSMRDNREWLSLLQNTNICYECLKPTCDTCRTMNGRAVFCRYCKKTYCTDCIQVPKCMYCSGKCEGCGDMKACEECGEAICEDCLHSCAGCNRSRCENCVEMYQCEGCTKTHCEECYNGKEYSVKYCEECRNNYCSECKFNGLKDTYGELRCNACAGDVAHLIVEEMDKLRTKNEELGKENEELRRKVESLTLSRV